LHQSIGTGQDAIDLPESSKVPGVCLRIREMHGVAGVECLGTDLHGVLALDGEVLCKRRVEVDVGGSHDNVTTRVAGECGVPLEISWNAECRGVEPLEIAFRLRAAIRPGPT